MPSKVSIGDRLAALERKLVVDLRLSMSKGERDALVAAHVADPANEERALAALAPDDHRGRAVIAAAFRADS